MDGFINSKMEKQTIYEIYRACRLCGAGAGYKMPIIQNVVDLDGAEVELKQKIRECVQIEVTQVDRMPPLICELCVDKVNDFYEFLEMCRQTNKRTRLRLGLPPQTLPRGAPDAGDCILGITEPVYLNDDSSEPLRSKGKNSKNSKNKEDSKSKISTPTRRDIHEKERDKKPDVRSMRNSRQASPPRMLRGTKRTHEDDMSLGNLMRSKRSSVQSPKSILKKNEPEELPSRTTRQKEKEIIVKKEVQNKKVKIIVKSPPRAPVKLPPSPPSPKSKPKSQLPKCKLCRITFVNNQALSSHMRSHNKKSVKKEVKVQCSDCDKAFPNRTALNVHHCSARLKKDKCESCGRFIALKLMKSHRISCRKAKDFVIKPSLLRKLRPMQIRIARCDPLLHNKKNGHYDVSEVAFDYGVDEDHVYPYLWSYRIKSEPGYMVKINDDLKEALDKAKYVHWDSDATVSDVEDGGKVDSLTSLSLKTIFSPKLLGKVPKKRRKIKPEKAFDSILNASDIDFNTPIGIDSIINRLDNDTSIYKDNDSFFGDDNPPTVTNDDFDALFGKSQENKEKVNVENKIDDVSSKKDETDKINQESKSKEEVDTENSDNKNETDEVNQDTKNKESKNETDEVNQDTKSKESKNETDEVNQGTKSKESKNETDEVNQGTKSKESKNETDEVNQDTKSKESNNETDEVNQDTKSKESNNETDEVIQDSKSKEVNTKNNESKTEKASEESKIIKKIVENDCIDNSENNVNEEKNSEEIDVNKESISKESNDKKKCIETNVIDAANKKFEVKKDEREKDNNNTDYIETNTTDLKSERDVNADQKEDKTSKTEKEDTEDHSKNDSVATNLSTETKEFSGKGESVNGKNDVDDMNINMDDLEDVSDSEMDDDKLMNELDAQIGEQ